MENDQIQIIEGRLKAAYNSRMSCETGDQWQMKAMRRIRRLGPLATQVAAQAKYLPNFEQFVWRLTPATCLLIVFMGTLIAHFGVLPETQLVKLILDESEEAFSLFSMMGLG